jgi:hypothetical protein
MISTFQINDRNSMGDFNSKKYWHDMVVAVRERMSFIPEGGPIRTALPSNRVDEIALKIDRSCVEDLKWATWPPLFLFIYRHSVQEVQEFERDIGLIVKHSKRNRVLRITQFLKAEARQDRLWGGGLFETFVKARFLKERIAVEFDYVLPNRKEIDIRLEIEGKVYSLECTVITESDEDRKVWERFMAAKKMDQNAVLSRPGKFDLPNSKSPSPYYDCLRFYAKVYDKLARNLNPRESQMAEDNSNILLISFYSATAPLSATSEGVGWALDELLADQPKTGVRLKDHAPGMVDISFLAWLQFTADDLHQRALLSLDTYCNNFHEIVAAPRKLGGILLFDGCSLTTARANYNAEVRHMLYHHEIARLEKLFECPPNYCRH